MIGIAILIMDQTKEQIPKIIIQIPQSYALVDLNKFLQKENKIPFDNFFLTNRPAERSQFTPERKIKSIRTECQQLDGNMVLLCYQSKVLPIVHETPQVPPSRQRKAAEDDSNCCMIM